MDRPRASSHHPPRLSRSSLIVILPPGAFPEFRSLATRHRKLLKAHTDTDEKWKETKAHSVLTERLALTSTGTSEVPRASPLPPADRAMA